VNKDSLIKGTVILVMAALVARVLGVVQRIPLQHLLSDHGMGTYGVAYNVYAILLTIATAGIPSTLSKLVSERVELGQYFEANRIYRASIYFAIITGVVMTGLLYSFAPFYAIHIAHVPDSILSIRALAPALLLFPVIAMMRGYFLGRQQMMPNGLSQITEQVMRLITAVGLAVLLLKLHWGEAWAAAGASFGGVMGSIGALFVMLFYYAALRKNDAQHGLILKQSTVASHKMPYRQIYVQIFKISLPIVLFSLTVPLVYLIDSSTLVKLLSHQVGSSNAQSLLGILTARAQSLAGIPIILSIALSQSIVPIISSAYAAHDMDLVKSQSGKALRLSILSGLPVILFIVAAASPINELIFTNNEGTGLIAFLTATALLQIVMQTSGAILMGLGAMRALAIHVMIGVTIKLVGSFVLAPWMGVNGLIAATALCFGAMMLLNLRVMREYTDMRIFTVKQWGKVIGSTALIYVLGTMLSIMDVKYLVWFSPIVNRLLNIAIVGLVVFLLHFGLLIIAKIVTKEDIHGFPAPLRKLILRAGSLLRQ